jgi:allantoinase
VVVDFTGTDQQVMAPINSTLACTKASVVGALIAVTDPDIPLNDAIIGAIESVIPRGTLVNPNYPAPTFSASADPAARVAETMLRALARLVPHRVPAGAYATGNNVVAGGVKPDGQPYLWYNFESGGCGARPGLDGNSAEHHLMGNSKNESAEVWEARYPVRVLSYRLVDDSGGAGRWRGGMGTERRIQLLADARLSGVSDHHLSGPVGIQGGGPGRPNGFAIERDGHRKSLQEQFDLPSPSKFWALPLKTGDVFVTVQAGGGGCGDPLERDRRALEADIRQGYVSRESAVRDYRYAGAEAGAGHVVDVGAGRGELEVEAMEMPRDFVGYADNPPAFEWPNRARLALNIVVNYEEGSERNRADGDEELEVLSEATYPARPGERELAQESMYEFGSRVGIWRIVRLFDQYDIPATIFACALALERNRPVARAFVDRGYDFVGHGYRWISHFKMSEDEEREQIRKAVESIREITGSRIRGWFTRPPQTVATRRILAEEGFLYDSGCYNDEIPFFQRVGGRPFMVVPYTLDVNDVRFWKGPSILTAGHFASYCIDTFDALYKEGGRAPRMMSVGLHPRIIGRPGRVGGLERFLSHVRRYEDVWITSRSDIASFWAERFAPEGTWNWPLPGAEDRETAGDGPRRA